MANLSNINNKFLVTTGGNVLIGQTSAIGSSIFQVTGTSTFEGNVGIGTDPGQRLHVEGSNHFVTFSNPSTTANHYAQVLLKAGNKSNFIWTANQNSTYWGGAGSLNIYTAETGSSIAFFTEGDATNTKLMIKADGKVGIGTNSPGSKLDILGLDLNIGADNGAPTTRTNSTVKVGVITSPHYTIAEENFTGMLLVGNTTANEVILGGGTSAYNSATQIGFYTSANTTTVTGTVKMLIDSSGLVSIPAYADGIKFEIKSSHASSNSIIEMGQTGSDGFLDVSAAGGGVVTHLSGYTGYASYFLSNVGIGTDSPATILDVRGSGANTFPATTGTTPSTGTRFRLANTGSASAALDFGISTGGKSWLQSTDRVDLSTEYPFLINPNGGNVGIGTTTVGSKLTVDVGNGDFYSDTNKGITAYDLTGGVYTAMGRRGIYTAGSHQEFRSATTYMAFYTGTDGNPANATERMRLNNVGQLLINATTSGYSANLYGYNLGVRGTSAQCFISIARSTQTLDTQGMVVGLDSNTGYLLIRDNIPLDFYNNNTFRMRIDTSGRVGIGTNSPTQKLDVNGLVKHLGLDMTAGVQVDQTTSYTKTLTGTANTWRPTGIDYNDIGNSGSYLVQVFSDDHSGAGPANYSWYWTGTMSWYAGATNNNVTSELYLQGCGHHTNMVLELRTKVNYNSATIPYAELEWKSATSFVNSPNWVFKFRRLM